MERHFLSWGSLFPNDHSLCQIDPEETSTEGNTGGGQQKIYIQEHSPLPYILRDLPRARPHLLPSSLPNKGIIIWIHEEVDLFFEAESSWFNFWWELSHRHSQEAGHTNLPGASWSSQVDKWDDLCVRVNVCQNPEVWLYLVCCKNSKKSRSWTGIMKRRVNVGQWRPHCSLYFVKPLPSCEVGLKRNSPIAQCVSSDCGVKQRLQGSERETWLLRCVSR